MGQKEVLDALKHDIWKSRQEIKEATKTLTDSSITKSLQRLRKYGFIEIKYNKNSKHGFLYKLLKK